MTEKKRQEIQARCDGAMYTGTVLANYCLELLDALDESDVENRRLAAALEEAEDARKCLRDNLSHLICATGQNVAKDKCMWQKHAEALEIAVKGDCNYCKFGPSIEYQCKRPTGTFCHENGEYWQLDEARFAKGGGDRGVD